jgi:hypothetical protein
MSLYYRNSEQCQQDKLMSEHIRYYRKQRLK